MLIKRTAYNDLFSHSLSSEFVRIVTGVRRSGKSALLELYREDLCAKGVKSEEILVVNFEDFANDSLRDAHAFHKYVESKIAHGVKYLHIDEVQELQDWARVVNSLRTRKAVEITITGSNASMFAGEGLTYLAGRYVQFNIFPLSFAEFREFRAASEQNLQLQESYANWLRIGGFPAAALAEHEQTAHNINSALFDSIFSRDIALRGNVRDVDTFIRVARTVFDSAGSQISPYRISNTLKSAGYSVSTPTVDGYLRLMVDAHMLYPCKRYDIRGRQLLTTGSKYYFVDSALRTSLLGEKRGNSGHDLENQIFIELLRRGYDVTTGVSRNGEIDFRAVRDGEVTFIQVALSALEPSTLARELSSFQGLPAGSQCVLMTFDHIPLDTGDVKHVNALDFLAGKL